jgi:hypothetical protein
MKLDCARLFLIACLAPALPLFMGCGSDNDDDDDSGGDADVPTMTGQWIGSYSTGVGFTLDLSQDGDAITGIYVVDGGSTGSVSGSLSGNEIALAVSVVAPPAAADLTGAVNEDRTSMGGSFMIIDGGGGSGTWSATK